MKGREKVSITPRSIEKYSGVKKYRYGEIEEHDRRRAVVHLPSGLSGPLETGLASS